MSCGPSSSSSSVLLTWYPNLIHLMTCCYYHALISTATTVGRHRIRSHGEKRGEDNDEEEGKVQDFLFPFVCVCVCVCVCKAIACKMVSKMEHPTALHHHPS